MAADEYCADDVSDGEAVLDRVFPEIAAELGETAVGSEHYKVLFTLGILLFSVTFVINLTADLIVRGVRKR